MKTKQKYLRTVVKICVFGAIPLLLSGCFMTVMSVANSAARGLENVNGVTPELASDAEDTARKNFVVTPGQAGIYVFRTDKPGKAKPLLIDGQTVGTTYPRTYLYSEVTPGKHVVEINSPGAHDKIEIEAEAETLYYVRQQAEWKAPLPYVRITLHPASEEEGRKGVLETHLAKQTAN